jgi:hypothetical protein
MDLDPHFKCRSGPSSVKLFRKWRAVLFCQLSTSLQSWQTLASDKYSFTVTGFFPKKKEMEKMSFHGSQRDGFG